MEVSPPPVAEVRYAAQACRHPDLLRETQTSLNTERERGRGEKEGRKGMKEGRGCQVEAPSVGGPPCGTLVNVVIHLKAIFFSR